jgi:hypothetical protein
MTPERRAKLLALDELHREFVARKLPSTPFDPENRPGSEDYNQHYVDLDGDDDEFHRRAMAIVTG